MPRVRSKKSCWLPTAWDFSCFMKIRKTRSDLAQLSTGWMKSKKIEQWGVRAPLKRRRNASVDRFYFLAHAFKLRALVWIPAHARYSPKAIAVS